MRIIVTVLGVAVACVALIRVTGVAAEPQPAKPKHSIKEVMVNAHKSDLLKKALAGGASAEEKMALLDHYVSLAENQPAKGTAESWHEKTDAIVMAAAKLTVGRADAAELLKAATDCAGCHKSHK